MACSTVSCRRIRRHGSLPSFWSAALKEPWLPSSLHGTSSPPQPSIALDLHKSPDLKATIPQKCPPSTHAEAAGTLVDDGEQAQPYKLHLGLYSAQIARSLIFLKKPRPSILPLDFSHASSPSSLGQTNAWSTWMGATLPWDVGSTADALPRPQKQP